MGFKINSAYLTDRYKLSHFKMLAPGTTRLYGTWIPRSVKHAPKGISKIVSFGQQMCMNDAAFSLANDNQMYKLKQLNVF